MAAVTITLAGLDPIRFIDSRDAMERNLMIKIANEVLEYQKIRDNNLAVKIVNGVGKLFGG